MTNYAKVTEGVVAMLDALRDSQAKMEATGYRSSADQDAGFEHPIDKTGRYYLSQLIQFAHNVLEGSSSYPSQVQRVAENEEKMTNIIESCNADASVFMSNNQFLSASAWRDYGQSLVDLAEAIQAAKPMDTYTAQYGIPWKSYTSGRTTENVVKKELSDEEKARADELLASLKVNA